MYYLQTRWKLEERKLRYFGLRNKERMFRNTVRLTKEQRAIVSALPKQLSKEEMRILGPLLGEAVVTEEELRPIPKRLDEARFCTCCCANDFILPGLEFDEEGRCPMCQTEEETRELKSVLPLVEEIRPSKRSRFDVALFYTGGKDSTFLLYYLSKVKGLRVLALTWEIPFLSDSARRSIEGAKKTFPKVEFIVRTVAKETLDKVYRKLYSLIGSTCACPSLAYLLFYPELVANRVPYFMAGNEPVQMLALYYNHMAPKIAYSFAENKLLTFLFNVWRVLTLRPPLRQGQIQALMTMKQLAYGDNFFKKHSGLQGEPVHSVVEAIHAAPELLPPLKRAIRSSSWTGHIPAFVHLDMDKACGGTYDWNRVKDLLVKECGWSAPAAGDKALHTSCKIERCKDYTQFVRYYNCESTLIPFSALEISLASRRCGRPKEEVIAEMKESLGFSLEEFPECALMREEIGAEQ